MLLSDQKVVTVNNSIVFQFRWGWLIKKHRTVLSFSFFPIVYSQRAKRKPYRLISKDFPCGIFFPLWRMVVVLKERVCHLPKATLHPWSFNCTGMWFLTEFSATEKKSSVPVNLKRLGEDGMAIEPQTDKWAKVLNDAWDFRELLQ